MPMLNNASSSIGRPVMVCFSVTPSRYSITMNDRPSLISDFVDRADSGVIQRRSGACLPAQSFQGLAVIGDLIRQKLERNEAAEFDVLCFISHPLPPPSFSRMR